MPTLPTHMAIGRSTMPGPVTGGYQVMHFGPWNSPTGTLSESIIFAFVAPCDMRLHRINFETGTIGGTSPTATLRFYKHTTINTTGATNIYSGTSVALTAATYDYIAPSGETAGTVATGTLVQAYRDISKGECLFATLELAGTSPNIAVFNVNWTVHLAGHPTTDPAND